MLGHVDSLQRERPCGSERSSEAELFGAKVGGIQDPAVGSSLSQKGLRHLGFGAQLPGTDTPCVDTFRPC